MENKYRTCDLEVKWWWVSRIELLIYGPSQKHGGRSGKVQQTFTRHAERFCGNFLF